MSLRCSRRSAIRSHRHSRAKRPGLWREDPFCDDAARRRSCPAGVPPIGRLPAFVAGPGLPDARGRLARFPLAAVVVVVARGRRALVESDPSDRRRRPMVLARPRLRCASRAGARPSAARPRRDGAEACSGRRRRSPPVAASLVSSLEAMSVSYPPREQSNGRETDLWHVRNSPARSPSLASSGRCGSIRTGHPSGCRAGGQPPASNSTARGLQPRPRPLSPCFVAGLLGTGEKRTLIGGRRDGWK